MAQLKSTNITGNLAVTGNILASKIIKLGGTTHELLLADGSVANISTTAQTVAPNAVTATSGRTYLIQKKDGQLVVNVPWNEGLTSALTEILISPGTGLSGGGTIDTSGGSVTLNHSNSVTAVTTEGLLKLKYDAQGHITGSTAVTKADITGLGIPSSDTGATSVEVTGSGDAIVNASYDTNSRKITLTKGGSFVSEVDSTDNAVVRFNGSEGSIQNSGITISDDNQLDVSAGSIKLNKIYAPSSSGGSTYTTGTNKYVLKSNGTTVYWAADSNSNTIPSAYCSTDAATAAKTASCTGYVLSQSSQLHIIMTQSNTAASKLTLNVNSKGAKPIYINGIVSSSTNYTLPAGSYIIYYDGTNYYFRTDGYLTANITGSANSLRGKTPETSLTADSDSVIPTSKAVADYIDNLGYVNGSYLPLGGGQMSGPITYPIASGNNKTSNYISIGGGFGTGSGKEGLKILALDQSDATMGLGVDLTGGPYELTVATSRKNNTTASKIVFATHTVGTTAYKTLATLSASGAEEPVAKLSVNGGVETSKILAPTTSGGTTYGVGTNGQVLKSNGTTVYWGTDNGLTSLPTRLAEYSSSGYGDANEATAQGWHYMTTTATNRPPFKQSSNKDYRIMSTAYSSSWVQQIATDFRGNDMFLRRRENGTWKPWTPIVRFQDCTADHKMQTITDNAIPRWDTGGTAMLQNSTATISDNGHLNINTTSDTTMTTPAIHVLHTGPANGSSTADLMILSGYNSAPYGFKFSTYGDGTAIIQSQRISGGNDEKFSLSLNPSGGDVLINGSKAATQAWVEGLGYITGSYLPLAGGTMTGAIKYGGVTREIISFAPENVTWRGGLKYSWSSNTTIGLWGKHVNSQFVWHAGTDFSGTDVNGTTTRTYDFQVGRDVGTGGSGDLEALLGGKPLATQDWVEGKGYLTSHQSLSGYVTGSGLTANYLVLGNGGSSIKKGNYQITNDIPSTKNDAYIPTAGSVASYVDDQLSATVDKKTSSSSKADTELKLVGAIDISKNGVETFTNPNCYIGTDNCLYSNGKKVATEDWVEAAIKDKIYSVKIYSEVLYDAEGNVNNAEWWEGWREDNNNGVWDPSIISGNSTATGTTTDPITSSNQTVTLRRPYSSQSSHSRWVMTVTASGMHGLSISGANATTIEDNKYKIQFANKSPQTITLSKGEATFVIQVQFQTASYQD